MNIPVDRRSKIHPAFKTHASTGLIKENEELKKLATTDPLTGLYNRRYLEAQLDALGHSGHIIGVTVFMLDIDSFKQINDEEGHDAGDAMLQKVATILKANFESTDTVARYGGDEFTVILPNFIEDTIIQNKLLELHKVLTENNLKVTFGFATDKKLPEEQFDFHQTLSNADKNLIEMKAYKNGVK